MTHHVDPHPFWGGVEVGIAALVVFLGFATWVIVQRVRHGRAGDDDDARTQRSSQRTSQRTEHRHHV